MRNSDGLSSSIVMVTSFVTKFDQCALYWLKYPEQEPALGIFCIHYKHVPKRSTLGNRSPRHIDHSHERNCMLTPKSPSKRYREEIVRESPADRFSTRNCSAEWATCWWVFGIFGLLDMLSGLMRCLSEAGRFTRDINSNSPIRLGISWSQSIKRRLRGWLMMVNFVGEPIRHQNEIIVGFGRECPS
jgi:hypothetical protein